MRFSEYIRGHTIQFEIGNGEAILGTVLFSGSKIGQTKMIYDYSIIISQLRQIIALLRQTYCLIHDGLINIGLHHAFVPHVYFRAAVMVSIKCFLAGAGGNYGHRLSLHLSNKERRY